MKNLEKALYLLTFLVFISCSGTNGEPLNAITDLNKFSHAAAESKFQQVTPINKEDIVGEWKMISSYFTIKQSKSVTTFQLEGRKYIIKEDGSLIVDNSAFGDESEYPPFESTWKLQSNNTVFHDGTESYHVRIYGDTMEWIEQTDEDYMYFVLVK